MSQTASSWPWADGTVLRVQLVHKDMGQLVYYGRSHVDGDTVWLEDAYTPGGKALTRFILRHPDGRLSKYVFGYGVYSPNRVPQRLVESFLEGLK